MNIEVQSLRRYIAVAEELHFARAAKALNIARTSLSRTIIDLEAELGYSLFVPGASPTQLTERGRDFLDDARALVADDVERRRAQAEADAAKVVTLTVGFTEGVTPTKWTRIWAERFPDIGLELLPTTVDTQLTVLRDGTVDVAFVRLPVEDSSGLGVVQLYEEVPVVVVPKDHPVAAFDRIAIDDLADEHLLQEPREVPEWAAVATEVNDGSRLPLPPIQSNAELFEYVAAGLGIAVVPQSIARLHARKDLVYRPVDGVAGSPVAIAWPSDMETENVENFFGIVRGRSVRSSRGNAAPAEQSRARSKKSPAKKGAAAKPRKVVPVKAKRTAPTRSKRPKR